jgi:hypothetical protein
MDAIRNGVDTEQLFGTLGAIKADPSLARFQFRARTRWINGAHNQTRIRDFYAANHEEASRATEFVIDAGEPQSCSAPTPERTRPSSCCTRSPRA